MDPEDTLVDIIEAVYDRAMLKTGRNTFKMMKFLEENKYKKSCLLYTSPSPRD